MNALARLMVLAAVALVAMPAFAREDGIGYYGCLRIIGSAASVDDVSQTGFGGTLQVRNDSDLVAGAAFVGGYRWNSLPMRTEVEVAVRFRFDFDTRDQSTPQVGYENNFATVSTLFNILYEYRNSSSFTPYVGGSLGWAQHRSNTDRDVLVSGGSSTDLDEEVNNFAWGGMLGVTWGFANSWELDLGYRYIDMGEVSSGAFPTGETITADDYTSHDILLGIHYRF